MKWGWEGVQVGEFLKMSSRIVNQMEWTESYFLNKFRKMKLKAMNS